MIPNHEIIRLSQVQFLELLECCGLSLQEYEVLKCRLIERLRELAAWFSTLEAESRLIHELETNKFGISDCWGNIRIFLKAFNLDLQNPYVIEQEWILCPCCSERFLEDVRIERLALHNGKARYLVEHYTEDYSEIQRQQKKIHLTSC